jgi:hypothetical protein
MMAFNAVLTPAKDMEAKPTTTNALTANGPTN